MKSISVETRKKAKKIKLLLLDVDGVLTDGGIFLNNRGAEIKRFDVRDGHGIRLLMRAGIHVGLITGRSSKAVSYRARELGIRIVYQRAFNKIQVYQQIKKKTGLTDQEIAYAGDDMVDLPILRKAGLAMTVRDGWTAMTEVVDYVTVSQGGRGAVREIVELLLRAQGKWGKMTQSYYS